MADSKRKPLRIDARMLKPLPQALWGTACDNCNRPQSKWRIFAPMKRPPDGEAIPITEADFGPTCSVCFLYESLWGKRQQEEIQRFIREVEVASGEKFLVDPTGRLVPSAADRILVTIAMTSEMFDMQDQIKAVRGPS
jgi:hypothetical protein